MRPRLLDLFCGAGGCSVGYDRAGFEIVLGVDKDPKVGKHYPYPFRADDAMRFLEFLVGVGVDAVRESFDVIHASPPCQAYSQAAQSQRNAGKEYPDLLAPTRDALIEIGLPWVIENVPRAPMRPDFRLCGCQFDLKLRRERWFEVSWPVSHLANPCYHYEPVVSVVGHGTPTWVREQLGYNPTIHDYRAAMGIDWMNRNELSQAIPPAYTEFIGAQLLDHIAERAA
jgi:DNA (cytosine-5)-methyltransferase 1